MFEITYKDEETLQSYVDCHKAYPGATYDFTFENRFIIYHAEVAHALHYIVLDMKTGYGSELCVRRIGQVIDKSEFREMTPKILSSIKYTGDRRCYDPLSEDPLEAIDTIFRKILPQYGYTVREEQIRLCKKMYIGLTEKLVALAEAEVGTGKSMASVVACVMARHHNHLLYDGSVNPVTISTSSIELQNALMERDIPMLSRVLMDYHLINRPLRAVLRKGKEHYFCRKRFDDFMDKLRKYPEKYKSAIEYLEGSNFAGQAFDLDRYKISPAIKSRICVKGNCKECPYSDNCRYRSHLVFANNNTDVDFQITNHNLYLTSEKMYQEEGTRILRYSDFVIIDEAHKFRECASTVFSVSITKSEIYKYLNIVKVLCKDPDKLPEYKDTLNRIAILTEDLFDSLSGHISEVDRDEERATQIELSNAELLDIKVIAKGIEYLESNRSKIPAGQPDNGRFLRKALLSFERKNNKNIWLDIDENGKLILNGTEKKISEILHRTIWDKYSSHVLTSGTMSDGLDFDYFCRENGIDRIARHLIQISKTESPFDYANHTRLFVAKDMPAPDNDDPAYIQALADKVVQIVNATNGHTAILFTSYKVLNAVYTLTKDKFTKYEVICMTRSNKTAIADFKKSKNGVLFASGSMWEGVDCIGDTLSSVIIVRLPFPPRSTELEQKKTEEESMREFIRKYALPEMLTKLRQGAGRLIRSETDTGVISILDSRADEAYKKDIDIVLGKYPKTTSIDELEAFMKAVKPNEYWR